jgi:hypothetical protein
MLAGRPDSLGDTAASGQEKADALQADAERKHSEIMGTINQQRTVLEGRLEQLRTFEREYRTRLKTYWSPSSRSSASAARPHLWTPAPTTAAADSTSSTAATTEPPALGDGM